MTREAAFDEIFDGQATFRVLLDCMARPGSVGRVPPISYAAVPTGLPPAALTMLKTLCDHRVSFAVGAVAGGGEWTDYLEVNLSCPSRPVAEADYVLMDGAALDPSIATVRRGSLEVPEGSGTVLLGVSRLVDDARGETAVFRLRGPGIRDVTELGIEGLDPRYVEERERCNAFFPMGFDVFLCDREGRVVGIPRTCRMERV